MTARLTLSILDLLNAIGQPGKIGLPGAHFFVQLTTRKIGTIIVSGSRLPIFVPCCSLKPQSNPSAALGWLRHAIQPGMAEIWNESYSPLIERLLPPGAIIRIEQIALAPTAALGRDRTVETRMFRSPGRPGVAARILLIIGLAG